MKLISIEQSFGGVIFYREKGEVFYLLLKYRNGHYSFPKGHAEGKENAEETFRRELEEETGITDVRNIQGFHASEKFFYIAKGNERTERINSGRGILIFKQVGYFLAESFEKKVILSHEHLGSRWLKFEDAVETVTFKNAKNILGKADRFLKKTAFKGNNLPH
jgi:8-oxo-dGTP pyrophosphatase MutT (NUDIX family)